MFALLDVFPVVQNLEKKKGILVKRSVTSYCLSRKREA